MKEFLEPDIRIVAFELEDVILNIESLPTDPTDEEGLPILPD